MESTSNKNSASRFSQVCNRNSNFSPQKNLEYIAIFSLSSFSYTPKSPLSTHSLGRTDLYRFMASQVSKNWTSHKIMEFPTNPSFQKLEFLNIGRLYSYTKTFGVSPQKIGLSKRPIESDDGEAFLWEVGSQVHGSVLVMGRWRWLHARVFL